MEHPKVVDQITAIMLRHMTHAKALKMTRELYSRVEGNIALTKMLKRIADKLIEEEERK